MNFFEKSYVVLYIQIQIVILNPDCYLNSNLNKI